MTQEEWLRDVEAQFFDVITKSDGLQELTDYAYTLLQNPIMVSNERGEFLAKPAQNRPYGDALWEEFDLKGYIPREKRSKMSTVYFKSQMRNDRIVILDKHYISHRLMVYQTELAGRFLLRGLLLESKRPFANMKDIAPYYRQNAQALDLALRLDAGASLHFFSDLFSAYMLRQLPPEGLNFLCYPPLFALLERDKQQGSCLVQSLYAYALCFGSCARAARLLGIHYNSMKSRLEQVRRELGPHLEELLPAVYLSVKALLLTQGESVADCRGLEARLGSRGEGVDLS